MAHKNHFWCQLQPAALLQAGAKQAAPRPRSCTVSPPRMLVNHAIGLLPTETPSFAAPTSTLFAALGSDWPYNTCTQNRAGVYTGICFFNSGGLANVLRK